MAIYLTNEGRLHLPEWNNEKFSSSITSDGLGIQSLKEKYKPNLLEIETKTYHRGKKIKLDEYNTCYEIEIDYFEIHGLIDRNIEEKINQEVKNHVFTQADEQEMQNKKWKNISVSAECIGNFSNILSVRITKSFRDKNGNWGSEEEFSSLNYDLRTGEKFGFSDVFTNDAGTKQILLHSAYHTFARDYLYDYADKFYNSDKELEWDGDMSKIDYSELEDRVFKILQNYDRNHSYPFCVNERYIFVFIENREITINMRDFYKQIAIYHRFANPSNIYEKVNPKEYFVFIEGDTDYDAYRRIELIENRFFIDVEICRYEYDENGNETAHLTESVIQKYVKDIEKKIKSCQSYLEKNPDKAMVLSVYQDVSYWNGEITDNTYIARAVMEKEYFQTTYMDKVLEWEQGEHLTGDMIGGKLLTFLLSDKEENKNIQVYEKFK